MSVIFAIIAILKNISQVNDRVNANFACSTNVGETICSTNLGETVCYILWPREKKSPCSLLKTLTFNLKSYEILFSLNRKTVSIGLMRQNIDYAIL